MRSWESGTCARSRAPPSVRHDESNLDDALPELVVRPGTAEEVAAVLALAIARGVPVTPSAARSGKSGGGLPVRGGVVLSVERLSALLEIRQQDLVGVAQPGIVTGRYQAAVEAQGLFYPPIPPRSTGAPSAATSPKTPAGRGRSSTASRATTSSACKSRCRRASWCASESRPSKASRGSTW